jgi:tRNA-dihydrouridine synthase 3
MAEQVPVKILESPNFCVGVKSEFLISKEQHLESKKLSLEKSETAGSETNNKDVVSSNENTEAGKSNKKRVRDRDTVKSDDKLCPAINRGKECSYGDKCTFTHDVHAFLTRKPKDIGLII